jgi:hypothetical protein
MSRLWRRSTNLLELRFKAIRPLALAFKGFLQRALCLTGEFQPGFSPSELVLNVL